MSERHQSIEAEKYKENVVTCQTGYIIIIDKYKGFYKKFHEVKNLPKLKLESLIELGSLFGYFKL